MLPKIGINITSAAININRKTLTGVKLILSTPIKLTYQHALSIAVNSNKTVKPG